MIRAKKIHALAVPLTAGGDAILVQDGPEWNNLQKFKCISPKPLDGQTIIATRDQGNSPFSALFGAVFQIDGHEKWVAVMATPELAASIKPEDSQASI